MDIRIGVVNTAKELALELPDDTDPASVHGALEAALAVDFGVFRLTDAKGRTVGVPADKIAYIDIDPGDGTKSFGFS
ncbi:MAG: DUF3107 domain-containing protein [Actinobacteria bacterium]|nr:DUF3107 domain-containing protein [Actinomycetota bacterium]